MRLFTSDGKCCATLVVVHQRVANVGDQGRRAYGRVEGHIFLRSRRCARHRVGWPVGRGVRGVAARGVGHARRHDFTRNFIARRALSIYALLYNHAPGRDLRSLLCRMRAVDHLPLDGGTLVVLESLARPFVPFRPHAAATRSCRHGGRRATPAGAYLAGDEVPMPSLHSKGGGAGSKAVKQSLTHTHPVSRTWQTQSGSAQKP